ncbi:hypothetical protein MD484_g3779, partial [Candolleomyces efflorescens]
MAEDGSQQPPPPPPPPPARTRHTHASEELCAHFKAMTLEEKLKFNKAIEGDNEGLADRRRTFIRTNKRLPTADDIPDDASFITVSEEEKARITLPSIWSRVKNALTVPLLEELAGRLPIRGNRKRKSTDADISDDPDSDTDNRPVKTRRHALLTPREEVERTYGAAQVQAIPDALLITDAYHGVPLTWLTDRGLSVLNSFTVGGLVPTKRYTDASYVGSITTWDVSAVLNSKSKVLVGAGMTSMLVEDFGEYEEAAANHIRLSRLRDEHEGLPREGEKPGRHEKWSSDHHGFFLSQKQKSSRYGDWRHLEAELREERYKSNVKFDLDYYVARYGEVLLEARLRRDLAPGVLGGDLSQGNFRSSNQSFRNAAPVPKTPRDSQSSPCILCAIRGHSVQGHDLAVHPKCLPDGKPFWARKRAGKERSLYDNAGTKEVCINYNYVSKKPCTHAADDDAQVAF